MANSCKKKVYKTMCEAPDGSRKSLGRGKVKYQSTPKGRKPKSATVKKKTVKKTNTVTRQTSVRAWYMKAYPTDDLGSELRKSVTFSDFVRLLNAGKDAYDIMGVGDSLIRERIFDQISKMYRVPYDIVYETWSGNAKIPLRSRA